MGKEVLRELVFRLAPLLVRLGYSMLGLLIFCLILVMLLCGAVALASHFALENREMTRFFGTGAAVALAAIGVLAYVIHTNSWKVVVP